MKEDRFERRKTSEKERTPLTFLLGGCFDGGEAKKPKKGERKNTPYIRCVTARNDQEGMVEIPSILCPKRKNSCIFKIN